MVDALPIANNQLADLCPGRGKVRARYFRGFVPAIDFLGGSVQKIFAFHGLGMSAFDDPNGHIDCIPALNMMEYCSSYFDDPLFGLRLADFQEPETFGCVTVLARSAATVRDAIRTLVDYIPVFNGPECSLELVEAKFAAELRWHSDLCITKQADYQGLLLFIKSLRMLGGEDFRPLYANLRSRAKRPALEALQERVGCRVHMGASSNGIAFPLPLLDRTIPTSDRTLYALLSSTLSQVRNATAKAPLPLAVEGYIRKALPTGICSIKRCAKELDTSIRTLQNRLADQGLTFSDLVEKQRIELAKQLLKTTNYSVDEIADTLGYADQSGFGRAFKRWTGVTPSAFRAASTDLSG